MGCPLHAFRPVMSLSAMLQRRPSPSQVFHGAGMASEPFPFYRCIRVVALAPCSCKAHSHGCGLSAPPAVSCWDRLGITSVLALLFRRSCCLAFRNNIFRPSPSATASRPGQSRTIRHLRLRISSSFERPREKPRAAQLRRQPAPGILFSQLLTFDTPRKGEISWHSG